MRRSSLVPITLAVLVSLSACGGDDQNDGASGGSESASETADSAPGDGDGDPGDGDGAPGDGDGAPGDGDGAPGDGDGAPGDGDGAPGDGDGAPGDGDGAPGDGDGDGAPGDGDGDGAPGDGDGDGDNCLPNEIACDGLDEDCNGIIDDLDAGQDGFCDCYKIGIIGNKGVNPAANFEAWLEDKGTTATRFGTAVDHVLTQAELDEFDILIIDRLTHVYSAQERMLLQQWLQAGHGVISMAGYTNNQGDIDGQNSLASAMGLAYTQPIYIDPVEVWDANHPLAQGAQGVQVYGGWRVTGAGQVFVRPQGEPNNSLGTAVEFGQLSGGIMFSDEWISFDSEWQAIPQVEVFWSNMIAWVGPKTFCADPQ